MKFLQRLHRRLIEVASMVVAASSGGRAGLPPRALALEALEPRIALAAAGLVEVGTQPEGALSDKIVYVHGGHGFTTINNGTRTASWGYQRPLLLGMVEDLGNQDQMSMFADYLWRAGATVVPLRPVGHQPHEVVLDNVDTEVTFSGPWNNSTASLYFGEPGEVPYRFASTSATETAVATYRPDMPEDGFYPVYAWTRYGSDRASDHLYRVNHAGGSTEVTVNHRRVGNGLVYLGTYYFTAGTAGSVEISNRSSESGRVVIADMIRFGNGVSDIDRGAGLSGQTREDETGLYWIQWHVDRSQGIPDSEYRATSSDSNASVSFSPRYAEYMNRETDGSLSDRVFVSFHSNAGGGSARGVLGLFNGNNDPATATPNQFLLANTLAREVNNDLVALNGQFEHNWSNRGIHVTLDRSDIEFGEINNLRIGGEFDATIIETGFHDNAQDAAMLRDPQVRDALARATYQGVVRYFGAVDGGATPQIMAPSIVTQIRALPAGPGSVALSWIAPGVGAALGDAPTGYRIYASTNGYGFDGGTYVAGESTTSATLHGLDPSEGVYYFRVAAVNDGGGGRLSEVVAATPRLATQQILIVNGFDRLERTQNPTQLVPGLGLAERVRPQRSNSFDYAVQVAAAIDAVAPQAGIAATSNEMVANGTIALADYEAVVWILGEESTADRTFDPLEQAAVTQYLAQGGKLLTSGAEIGWDLDSQNNGRAFYNNVLKADFVSDDAATYAVSGASGSIFAGLSFSFDNGQQFYDVNFPDVIAPLGGATTALRYVGGTSSGAGAGIQYADPSSGTRLVMFGFPLETITDARLREAVLARTLEFFDVPLGAFVPSADFDSSGVVDGRDFLAWQRGFGAATGAALATGDANGDSAIDGADLAIWEAAWGAFGAAQTSAVAATVAAAAEFVSPAPTVMQPEGLLTSSGSFWRDGGSVSERDRGLPERPAARGKLAPALVQVHLRRGEEPLFPWKTLAKSR